MLFEPDRHEALHDTGWDDARAAAFVQEIVQDIERNRAPDGRWPLHPRDDEGDEPGTGFTNLYLGRAGVLWALWYLQREGAVETGIDVAQAMVAADADYQADPQAGNHIPSYFLGESGILLALWCMTGSAEVADRLHACVRSNIGNPANESLWAAPGTMLAAWHLWEATHEDRWRELFIDNIEQVWRTWVFDAQHHCHLWTQEIEGKTVQYLGAGHGFAGNAYPLLKGAALLDAGRRAVLYERCVETLNALGRFEQDAVNWPPGTYVPRPGGARMLVQWCHGAPGIVTALSDFPPGLSADMDSLLTRAGLAIWMAGPLAKGYGLCHGTAGNGYAFLKLYERTHDKLWLARARSFAVHAMMQREQMRQEHGQGRYTLWTGDAGLAVYIWHCLRGKAALPALDIVR